MAQKQLLIIFQQPPIGTIYYAEGLRLAMGVATMSKEEHTVEIVYNGDGAYFALQSVDRIGAAPFISALLRAGCVLKVDEESLASRHISHDSVATDIEIINHSKVKELIKHADFGLNF